MHPTLQARSAFTSAHFKVRNDVVAQDALQSPEHNVGRLPMQNFCSARPYAVREYARLQGVPDSFSFVGSDNDAYRMIGNGVSVPVGEWIGSEIVRYFQQAIAVRITCVG